MNKRNLFRSALPFMVASSGLAWVSQVGATIYTGNGATGFGGPVGTGTLSVTDDGSGNVTFAFKGGAVHPTLDGNDLVVYLATGAPGLTDTSSLVDNGDGGREAVSGYDAANPSRSLVSFPTGFQATYALSIQDNFVSLFSLPLPNTVNFLTFITGTAQSSQPDTLTFPIADLGLATGSSFSFVGTDIATNAYRSNETIGTSVTLPGTVGDTPNAGFAGSTTFATADTYPVAVPEPTALAGLAVAGFVSLRRRPASAHR